MNKFNRLIAQASYLFTSTKSVADIKSKYNYLRSSTTLLSPLVVEGDRSDRIRSRLNNSFRNPIVTYEIDKDQEVRLYALTNLDLKEKIRTKNTNIWIITHGFADGFDQDFIDVAEQVKKYYPNDVVLGLDWSLIANGLSPALSVDVHRSATWIKPISEVVFERLLLWGLNSNVELKTIGHSLGSLLCSEIALRYKEKFNKCIPQLIALDPPSEITAKLYKQSRFLVQANPAIERVSSFAEIAEDSLALVGYNSIAGNHSLASSADRSYLVKFNDVREIRNGHFWVVRGFEQFLRDVNIIDNISKFNQYLNENSLILNTSEKNKEFTAIINLPDKKWFEG